MRLLLRLVVLILRMVYEPIRRFIPINRLLPLKQLPIARSPVNINIPAFLGWTVISLGKSAASVNLAPIIKAHDPTAAGRQRSNNLHATRNSHSLLLCSGRSQFRVLKCDDLEQWVEYHEVRVTNSPTG